MPGGFAIKIDLVQATNLDQAGDAFCSAWILEGSGKQQEALAPGLEVDLGRLLAESTPQMRTRPTSPDRSRDHPSDWATDAHQTDAARQDELCWNESAIVKAAISRGSLLLSPLNGGAVTLIFTVHTSGLFGMEELVGYAQVQGLRPHDVVSRKCFFYSLESNQQILGRGGNPAALHVRAQYLQLQEASARAAQSPNSSISTSSVDRSLSHLDTTDTNHARKPGPKVLSTPKAVLSGGSDPRNEHASPFNLTPSRKPSQGSMSRPQTDLHALHPFIYEIRDWQIVEGFQGNTTLQIPPTLHDKSVVLRGCRGSASQCLVLQLNRTVETLVVEHCHHVRLLAHTVRKQVLVSGCGDVELLLGGSVPRVQLIASSRCSLTLWEDTWCNELHTVGCSDTVVVAARSDGGSREDRHAARLATAPARERVAIPDALQTTFHNGTLSTQCYFARAGAASAGDKAGSASVGDKAGSTDGAHPARNNGQTPNGSPNGSLLEVGRAAASRRVGLSPAAPSPSPASPPHTERFASPSVHTSGGCGVGILVQRTGSGQPAWPVSE